MDATSVKTRKVTFNQAVKEALLVGVLQKRHGVYIPKIFVDTFDMAEWHVDHMAGQIAVLHSGPHAECYWGAWQDILNEAKLMLFGEVWGLYHNENLYAICTEDNNGISIEISGL